MLLEKREPSNLQTHPEMKPQPPETGPETCPGTTQKLMLGLKKKEEPEVTENLGESKA